MNTKKSANKKWTIRQTSNRGVSHPVYARLIVQMDEFINWSKLSERDKDRFLSVCRDKLEDRLGRCWDIWSKIYQEKEKELSKFQPSNERIIDTPYIKELDRDIENFLYEAKNFLRDLLNEAVKLFYPDITFNDASSFFDSKGKNDGQLTSWASSKFGSNHKIARMLRKDQIWIEELVRKRNAVEHPNGHSGSLTIQNFEWDKNKVLIEPVWMRDGKGATYILDDIMKYCDWLLSFAEDLIIFGCIEQNLQNNFHGITFYEIPEEKRNAEIPIRFRLGFK